MTISDLFDVNSDDKMLRNWVVGQISPGNNFVPNITAA